MFRYSDRSIFGIGEISPCFVGTTLGNFPNVTEAIPVLQKLLCDLRNQAASGGPLRKYAMGEAMLQGRVLYVLVQCTPDSQELQCEDCLDKYIGLIQTNNITRKGGGADIVGPSCNIRYELYPFYQSLPDAPPPSSSPSPSPTTDFPSLSPSNGTTENFSDANKLGQGGFGIVYKGMLLNGQDIAVKRLSRGSGQGELEFKNEILLVAKLHHRNSVRLLGFCFEGMERLLIYEFLPNGSLDHFIFDLVRRSQLNWKKRYEIIKGIARGLFYLHEESRIQIIHCDLKASNILLDAKMNPKISDFGMARLFSTDQTQGKTSRIVGTYGYMAPEYAMHGNFSVKSDVYSFGVLTLEIMSGQRNNCFHNGDNVEDLLNHAWKSWREGTISNLIDPILRCGSISETMRCVHIGLLCVQENVTKRPTMDFVVLMLSGNSLTLPVPSRPPSFMHSSME
ncbi:putative receptor-like protein kinase At4g00960 [Vitis riparia]|uniref:putative receptor-like protein kinase At4g00960 n=1 Tax=Vitis riparia TaxID=96939 RepID=UPI00155AC0CE|nr:putative receptor-like protein kinase At4g00960 [Vitis riparia]